MSRDAQVSGGGVNGGLKVLVNDIQQNQATQGHGQGYLGALKTLTPELVDGVDILNGPFSAEYGDFSEFFPYSVNRAGVRVWDFPAIMLIRENSVVPADSHEFGYNRC